MDGPDGTSHYVVSLGGTAASGYQGSISYLSQNGSTNTIGNYTATVSGANGLSMVLSTGQTLQGTTTSSGFTLSNCSSVLTMSSSQGCAFTYHGHVP